MKTLHIKGYDFLLDDDVYEWAHKINWQVYKAERGKDLVYARCEEFSLHRRILGLEEVPGNQVHVDHEDNNTLDCRRSNLRPATPSQNACNRRMRNDNKSGVKGVCRDKATGLWEVRVKLKGKQRFGGRFTELVDAAEAARALRAEMHGRFANNG